MADVEALSSSVVREYLSRKGLTDTLHIMDKEMPRTTNCISNRNELAKVLKINKLMKENSRSKEKYRTMLEVVVKYILSKVIHDLQTQTSVEQQDGSSTTSKSTQDTIPKGSTITERPRRPRSTSRQRHHVTSENQLTTVNTIKTNNEEPRANSHSQKQHTTERIIHQDTSPTTNIAAKTEELLYKEGYPKSKATMFDEHKTTKTANKRREPGLSGTNKVKEQTDISMLKNTLMSADERSLCAQHEPNYINTMKDAENSDPKYSIMRKSHDKQSKTKSVHYSDHGDNTQSNPSSRRGTSKRSGIFTSGALQNTHKTETKPHLSTVQQRCFTEEFDRHFNKDENVLISNDNLVSKKSEVVDWKKGVSSSRNIKKTNTEQNTLDLLPKKKSNELIFEDIEDDFHHEISQLDKLDISNRQYSRSNVQSSPIPLDTAKALKTIIFGGISALINNEWRYQGFTFSEHKNLKYGIVQHKGGPCGLLASVQAVVLKYLFFTDTSFKNSSTISSNDTQKALCSAITEIIWRAGSRNTAIITLRSDKEQFDPSPGYKFDGVLEKLLIYKFSDHDELHSFLNENISQFASDQNSGCILLLCSVVLSRTIARIKEDMDDCNGTLMGAHGYCTQDMVNLILTGKAVSNTFDNVIELDTGGTTKNILKGIEKQSDIGLLSLFEHYKSCLVGSHFKNPKYAIWVVCSESHFSVLFSQKKNVLNDRRSERIFDLFYYDGLARQDEEIKLTIDISNEFIDIPTDDLTPPLELCIRTRWKNALIDWNDTEPLL